MTDTNDISDTNDTNDDTNDSRQSPDDTHRYKTNRSVCVCVWVEHKQPIASKTNVLAATTTIIGQSIKIKWPNSFYNPLLRLLFAGPSCINLFVGLNSFRRLTSRRNLDNSTMNVVSCSISARSLPELSLVVAISDPWTLSGARKNACRTSCDILWEMYSWESSTKNVMLFWLIIWRALTERITDNQQ